MTKKILAHLKNQIDTRSVAKNGAKRNQSTQN